MITKNFCNLLLLLFCVIGLVSCNDDKETQETFPLSFEKNYYEISSVGQTKIGVRGGNRDYNLSVENPQILDISVDLSSPIGMGTLVVTPKMKGETIVTVKDNISNDTVHLKIKVTYSYLVYSITESNHPALQSGTTIFWINNANKDCYFFHHNGSNEIDSAPIMKGTYDFFIKLEYGTGNTSPTYAIPYLTLNYASDNEGHFTTATQPSHPHHFRFELYDGVTTANIVLPMIQSYLGVDWKELTQQALKSKMADVTPPVLKMTVDDTDYTIIGIFNTTTTIPEDILE